MTETKSTYDGGCKDCSHKMVCRFMQLRSDMEASLSTLSNKAKEKQPDSPFTLSIKCAWFERKLQHNEIYQGRSITDVYPGKLPETAINSEEV